jgi:uncharacterized protein with HEPN domain
MSDPELVQDILANIMIAIARIERRFASINAPDDFLANDDGIDRLDGIAMMLIAMGEQVKRLATVVEIDLDASYPEVDWKGVKGIRDFLSHHYFVVDAEVVFDVCQNKLAGLKQVIQSMMDAQAGTQGDPRS